MFIKHDRFHCQLSLGRCAIIFLPFLIITFFSNFSHLENKFNLFVYKCLEQFILIMRIRLTALVFSLFCFAHSFVGQQILSIFFVSFHAWAYVYIRNLFLFSVRLFFFRIFSLTCIYQHIRGKSSSYVIFFHSD